MIGVLDLAHAHAVDVALEPRNNFCALETNLIHDLPADCLGDIGVSQVLLKLLDPLIALPQRRAAVAGASDHGQPSRDVTAGCIKSLYAVDGKNATAAGAPRKVVHVAQFPSLKAKKLMRVLQAQPLGYEIVRQKGSHRKLEAPNHPAITFAFHDNQTIRPSTVKEILCNQVGLAEQDALALL